MALGERTAEMNALAWSITAMKEATERLPRVRARDSSKAFAVVGEAVWWVTIVDATMVRYHADTYDQVLDQQTAAERELIEQTLAGLRFVRNQMAQEAGHAGFIGQACGDDPDVDADGSLVADWIWQPMPPPAEEAPASRDSSWELSRYHAYQARLARCTVGKCFDRVVAFLEMATAAS